MNDQNEGMPQLTEVLQEEERLGILREAAIDHLFDLMSDASEDHWCAGWMAGTEISLWKAIQQYPEPMQWGTHAVDLQTVRKLHEIALAVDGWWVWDDDGQRFVSLSEWKQMYARYFKNS